MKWPGIGISPMFSRGGEWTPASINPDLYFDVRNIQEFEDDEYADTLNFQEIAAIYNQVSGNDAEANADIPIIQRQSVFGYNAVNCLAGGLTVSNYAGINYQYNQAFYIAFSFTVFDTDNRTVLNKRADGTGKGGWYVELTDKILFGFSDVTNGDVIEVEMDTAVNDNLPHTVVIQNSNGTAAGVSFYLDGVLQSKTIITNLGGLSDIQGGSLKIGTDYAASHDAPPIYISTLVIGSGTFSALSQYQTFVSRDEYWWTQKYPTNPVIAGTSQSAVQAYPSGGMYWSDTSKYYRYVGSTSTKIVCMSSNDGYTWAEEGVVISAAGGTWDEGYTTLPMVRVVGGTIYLFLLGAAAGSDYNYSCGVYTSASPTSGFTQNPTPRLAVAAYNSVFSNNMTGVYLSDVVKVSGTYYWFGAALDVCRSEMFYATSSTFTGVITPIAKICSYTEADYKRSLVQGPQVFKTAWGWMMIFTVGLQGSTNNERNLRCAVSTSATPTDWTILNEDYINPSLGTWDTMRVYVNSLYKEFDDDSYKDLLQISGSYVDYYSGHDLGANSGQTGINEFDTIPNLTSGRTVTEPAFTATALDSLPSCISRIFSDEHVYYTANGLVYQVLSSVTYKETTPIGADSERPLIVDNELNGYPIIRFSGNRLRYGKSLGNPSSWTASFLVKTTDLAAVNNLFGALNSVGGELQDLIQIMTTGAIRVLIGNDAADDFSISLSTAGDITTNTWNVIHVTYTNGDTFMRIYKNSVELVTTNPTANLNSTGTVVRSFGLGAASFNGGNTFIGDLAYFAFYDDALSLSDIEDEYNFLAAKYNL